MANQHITGSQKVDGGIITTNLKFYPLSTEPTPGGNSTRVEFSWITGITATRDNIDYSFVFISPNGLQYTFDRFSSSTSSTYFYAEPYPRKTLIEKEFNWNYPTNDVGTSAVALKFSDNTTSVDFYSHGGDLLITGGVYGVQNSGGNHYVGISIDNGEVTWISSSSFTSWHYIPLNKLVRGLSVGSHNIRVMAYTNVYTANFVGASLSKVIFQEV